MKILLVNNRESPQTELIAFLKRYGTVDVIHFQSISILALLKVYIQRPDLIVLSGSGEVPLNFAFDMYPDELELIKTTPFPILGICFGFEAISVAHKEKLVKSEKRIVGLNKIILKDIDKEFTVWQSHDWKLQESKSLEVIGESGNGIEIIKSPNKNVIGIQFHPEQTEPKNDGAEIFEHVLKLMGLESKM